MSKTRTAHGMEEAHGAAPSRDTILALAIFCLLLLVPLVAHFTGDQYLLTIATRMMIFSVAALSLNLVLGFGGMVSFGHAAYVGLGAYCVAILSFYGVSDILIHVLAAIAVSATFAAVTGFISLRTQGIYFIMITLAFGQMAYFLLISLSTFGGDDGMTIPSRSTLFGNPVLQSNLVLYFVSFVVLALAFLFSRSFVGSRFGRVLRGARDNEVRMRAIGYSPFAYRLGSYVLASILASLAGVLLANQVEYVSPAYMSWQRSAELIIMVVLGGMGTLAGPIIGAIGLLAVEELLAAFTVHWKLGLGLLLILVVYLRGSGFPGLRLGRRVARS